MRHESRAGFYSLAGTPVAAVLGFMRPSRFSSKSTREGYAGVFLLQLCTSRRPLSAVTEAGPRQR